MVPCGRARTYRPTCAGPPDRRASRTARPGVSALRSGDARGVGEDAVDPLVRLLEVEDDTELRGFAAQALTRIGEPAIERLREAVEAGGALGAVAGLVLWQMEEPGVQALVDVYCPGDQVAPGEEAPGSAGPQT